MHSAHARDISYLEDLVRDGRTEHRIARRARVLWVLADSTTLMSDLAERFELDRRTIWAFSRRFDAFGMDVVMDAPSLVARRRFPTFQRVGVVRLACCEPTGVGLHMILWRTCVRSSIISPSGRLPRPRPQPFLRPRLMLEAESPTGKDAGSSQKSAKLQGLRWSDMMSDACDRGRRRWLKRERVGRRHPRRGGSS